MIIKKKTLLIFVTLVSLILLFTLLTNYQKIIYLLTHVNFFKPINFIIYIFIILIFFLTPFPTTIIILFNGFAFKEYGFIISYVIIIISSIILFYFSTKLDEFLIFKKILNNIKDKTKIYNYTKKNYSILLSRFVIPFFFHNVCYGLIKIKFIRFILIIALAEIPVTFSLNSIGSSLKSFYEEPDLSLQSMITNINFYVPFLIVIVLFFFINKIKIKR
jgi:uncharacterized membrane protein YdjX (TVP38/TMEM64 family)